MLEKPTTKQTGNKGEQVAMQHLQQQGLEIVEMNYRFGHGEIAISWHAMERYWCFAK
jgi:Holliday junction resolvase-like predicted endonuclease